MKSSLNALHTLALIARVRSGEEGREGVQALLEKRSPSWLPRTDA